MQTKITARDFFLHIAVIALLYTGTVALLNLLFRVTNVAFPQIDQGFRYYSTSISFPVATLIVVFPLFLFLSNILRKGYELDPSKREYPVRKWLIYITLFIAGAVLAGDLITLIYFFLDGRELTTSFLLKVLAVLVVIGGIFGYYIDDLKGRLDTKRRNLWRTGAAILVLGSIVVGFSVLGSPATQRAIQRDSQKASDLQNIQWQIVNYWQQKGELPATLEDLDDPLSGFASPLDSQTGQPYEYTRVGDISFELCATFNRESDEVSSGHPMPRAIFSEFGEVGTDTWRHPEGRHCFERTIDPDLYPVRPR